MAVTDAILAGIDNDLGSGSQVDLCVMTTAREDVKSGWTSAGTHTVYRRCAVPEESLPALLSDLAGEDSLKAGDVTVVSSTKGVDGFGNVDFAIRSKRVVAMTAEKAKADYIQKWNSILGI